MPPTRAPCSSTSASATGYLDSARLTADGGLTQAELGLDGRPATASAARWPWMATTCVAGAPGFDADALDIGAAYAFYQYRRATDYSGYGYKRRDDRKHLDPHRLRRRAQAHRTRAPPGPTRIRAHRWPTASAPAWRSTCAANRLCWSACPASTRPTPSGNLLRGDVGAFRRYSLSSTARDPPVLRTTKTCIVPTASPRPLARGLLGRDPPKPGQRRLQRRHRLQTPTSRPVAGRPREMTGPSASTATPASASSIRAGARPEPRMPPASAPPWPWTARAGHRRPRRRQGLRLPLDRHRLDRCPGDRWCGLWLRQGQRLRERQLRRGARRRCDPKPARGRCPRRRCVLAVRQWLCRLGPRGCGGRLQRRRRQLDP
jgi:hypothetical protein